MDKLGSFAFTASDGAGGGVHAGIAAAIFGLVGRNETLDVDERNRLLKEMERVADVVRDDGKMRLSESKTINLRVAWWKDECVCRESVQETKRCVELCLLENDL